MTITCADCGSTQTIPTPLPARATAVCHRCGRVLDRHRITGLDFTLACAAAMFLLLPPAVFLPLMHSTIRNLVFEESRLVSSVPVIYSEVWFPFAFGFLFFAFLFPALRSFFLVMVLGSIRFGWPIPNRGPLFRWSQELRIWSMTDVVLIAGAVAYFRAAVPADVEIMAGAWCYAAVAVLAFLIDHSLDKRAVWNAIYPDSIAVPEGHVPSCDKCELAAPQFHPGDACPRCAATLDRNVAKRFGPALGAVAAAIPLCLPAYSFSVMVNDQLTAVLEHTIIGTVQLLADHGFWQGSVIVLIAGVAIPFVEIVGLLWLLARVRFPSKHGLVLRTRVYRTLHHLMRWPMILPFIAGIAAPIVDFRGIDDIAAGPGATPLFALIALIMLAMRLFEPRLMWKTAGETR